ncbi:hypothetical protein [Ideonella sp. YS5]|uniref:hypothetical protein n=1 Tax=Ideonella sp. YS5 TaxID=3453714 RepID=UPI003F703F1E
MGRLAVVALAVVGYALLTHWLTVHAAGSAWALLIVWGPLLLSLAGYAAARRRWVMLSATVAGLALVAVAGSLSDLQRMYLLQHAGIHAVLGLVFGATLRPGHVPMITKVALRVHGDRMLPAMHTYTRQVTVAWVAYFGVMVSTSLALYAWAPWSWWSAFANLATPVALVLMFIAEWRLRYWLHPDFERVPITTAMRAFRQSPAAGTP